MCERCERVSPLDTHEKMENFIDQCFRYGQDLRKREVPTEDAAKNALEFVDKLGVPTPEITIGIAFANRGFNMPDSEGLHPILKMMILGDILGRLQSMMNQAHGLSDEEN